MTDAVFKVNVLDKNGVAFDQCVVACAAPFDVGKFLYSYKRSNPKPIADAAHSVAVVQ